jgi:flagellar hook-associated protein 3 FlgL
MIKGFDSLGERFLADLSRIHTRAEKLQRQISSGYLVSRSSDAPERVMNIVQLRSDIQRARTIGRNLERVKAEVDTGEAALAVATKLLERARVLGAQGSTGTIIDRPGLEFEARQLHEQMVSLTHTVSEGRYIFSGDYDDRVLYRSDLTQTAGVERLVTPVPNTRTIEDINGTYFQPGRSAHEIFDERDPVTGDPTQNNVFNAIHQLAEALKADDAAQTQAATNLIGKALDHLNRQVTFYGQLQNRVDAAVTNVETTVIARSRELSETQDTDLTEALVNLTMVQVHQDTALAAHGKLPRTSLFDYLA